MADEKEGASNSNVRDISVRIDESSPFPGAVRYAAAVPMDSGSILIFGGYENMNQKDKKSSVKVWFYNSSINQYIEMKSLPHACSWSAAKTPDGKVVLIGGKKMVIYTPWTKNADHEIEPFPFGGDVILFDADNNLHILGGGDDKQKHGMIQWAPNKKDRKFVELGSLPNKCYHSGACCVNNKIYYMGCYDGNKQNSLWIYDVKDKSWKSGTDIPFKRTGFGCHPIHNNEEIILIGNRFGKDNSEVILIYNIAKNAWRKSKTKLPIKIGFQASAILSQKNEIHGFSGYNVDKNIDKHFIVTV